MNNIGYQLKQARLKHQMDQEELAFLTDLHVETISAIEEEMVDVQVSILYKLSHVLKCTFSIGDMTI
ncbi:helix-turn-helix transcriptional regulator [Neobacillus sp. PS3-40]|jgi:DNA-binding XRE family transcriptional regulator|uniref:helix-turn-helix domain-containing protein n=1 Tax=Neobacillus sp. PS3-40 TaxID=3070679 RepID=UPI0027DF3917|nr:helix-turn-helix transcriptional regulator [Neobacillus sp. PS3-40]WML44298.1 helix-turn-helix transcriptional regulator [Neobacillus sp. PS3-40]